MTTHERGPDTAASRSARTPGTSRTTSTQPYTGVVLIHGLGDIPRNEMLQQDLNALSYWLNHEAGFAFRSEGPGRLWLTTELTDDENPDARASRATVELTAPGGTAPGVGTQGSDSTLRLDFREVWWAESFGQPDIATTIRWARVQWREQWHHLLIPIGGRIGPAHTAARAPARQTPQALTYRPLQGGGERRSEGAEAAEDARGGAARARSLEARLQLAQRVGLRAALWLYDLFQYVWKALQWLILTPAITLLLLVMGVVQVLALVPFLRPAIVAGFNAITDTIMLHWVAEVQVYLLDYTRSSAIRQRFERELDAFLRDPACERVVVLAESMGTVIAYEGLTTILAQPDLPNAEKPITFICLGAALRRVWLLADADPHRLHGVMPAHVRWLNFWARYDPIPAGPLSPSSLPALDEWDDPDVPNPYPAMCASLEHCENIDVVNTDSTLADHTSYWDNLEQVVGPIARELVAGHPALERAVQAHLATEDDVRRRRGRIAIRATVAILGGLAAGVGFLLWDYTNLQPLSELPFGFGHALLTYGPILIGQEIGSIAPLNEILKFLGGGWSSTPFAHSLQYSGGVIPQSWADGTASVAASLAVTGLGVLAIGRLIESPSPLDLSATPKDAGTPRSIPVLAGISLVVLMLGIGPVSPALSPSGLGPGILFRAMQALTGIAVPQDAITTSFYLAAVLGILAVMLGLIDAARRQRWGWLLLLLLMVFAFALPIVFYAGGQPVFGITPTKNIGAAYLSNDVVVNAGVIGLAGITLGAIESLRRRRWSQLVGLLLVLIALGDYALVALVTRTPNEYFSLYSYSLNPYVAVLLGLLLYGLWSNPARLAAERAPHAGTAALPNRAILRYGLVVLVMWFSGFFIATPLVVFVVLGGLEVLIALAGAALAVVSLSRARRWGWIAALLIFPPALFSANYAADTLRYLTDHTFYSLWVLFAFFLPVPLLSIGLWAAPIRSEKGKLETD